MKESEHKYLWSTIQSNKQCTREVNKRGDEAWVEVSVRKTAAEEKFIRWYVLDV